VTTLRNLPKSVGWALIAASAILMIYSIIH
jgi:hypothetical protein